MIMTAAVGAFCSHQTFALRASEPAIRRLRGDRLKDEGNGPRAWGSAPSVMFNATYKSAEAMRAA